MPIAERPVSVGICDSCGTLKYGDPAGEGPDGFSGRVTQTADGRAGERVDWFACKQSHVGPAVRAALNAAKDAALDAARTEQRP